MKFAHLADCHLGSWRQPELQELNMMSFRKALDTCVGEQVDFILISGDLFDSAYPSIDILKETFAEFKRLKEAGIPCFIIAGSHDYSVSGKSFLDVLEKAGFCRNACIMEERGTGEGEDGGEREKEQEGEKERGKARNSMILNPIIYKDAAIYGYPGKKSGLEIEDLKRIKLQDAPGFFKIFMLHTTITGAKGSLPIDSVDESSLPKVEYYALGHLHINYSNRNFVYSGPIFPNNFQELEELKAGSFYIIDTESGEQTRIEIKLRDVEIVEIEINNALLANESIIKRLSEKNLKDKIVLLKLKGRIEKGKISNINFLEIENFVKSKEGYSLIRSISQLVTEDLTLITESEDIEGIEEEIIKSYCEDNPSQFNRHITSLMKSLDIDKQEDEKSTIFLSRLFSELNKLLSLDLKILK